MLEMLPYPSGEPHIGHLKNYSVGDAVAHFHRRQGMRVLHPMGYDAFGLPAENHAISTGQHPRDSTNAAIASFQRQFREWGISIDWSREFGTHEPRYYRWTQWIFLQLFERGLAYRKEAAVKWCPNDQTVLANEQVIDGRCERCGHEVEVRQLEQWFFRITDYADRLLDDLDTIEWPAHVKTMQRNWIGRSEGAEVTFRCEELGIDYPVFTTRPDTLFGATFFVMAPEHPDVFRLVARDRAGAGGPRLRQPRADRVQRGARRRRPREDRRLPRPLRRQPGQRRAPADVRRRLRAHGVRDRRDHGRARRTTQRDHEFATKFDLPIREVVARRRGRPGRGLHRRRPARELAPRLRRAAQPRGARARSSPGWIARARATRRSTTACATGCSRASATGAARSRSSTASAAGSSRCPRTSSRSLLPDVDDYAPKGRSPLAAAEDWVNVTLPVVRRPRAARDRHDGHLRRLVLVLHALLRRRQRRGAVGPRRARRAGCPSTSTSAASSTRSCT